MWLFSNRSPTGPNSPEEIYDWLVTHDIEEFVAPLISAGGFDDVKCLCDLHAANLDFGDLAKMFEVTIVRAMRIKRVLDDLIMERSLYLTKN